MLPYTSMWSDFSLSLEESVKLMDKILMEWEDWYLNSKYGFKSAWIFSLRRVLFDRPNEKFYWILLYDWQLYLPVSKD